jgi:hypothetical protein
LSAVKTPKGQTISALPALWYQLIIAYININIENMDMNIDRMATIELWMVTDDRTPRL